MIRAACITYRRDWVARDIVKHWERQPWVRTVALPDKYPHLCGIRRTWPIVAAQRSSIIGTGIHVTAQAAHIAMDTGSEFDRSASDDPAARPQIVLLPGAQRRAESGHPWVYSNEIA